MTFALTRKISLVTNPAGELDITVLPCLATSAFTTRATIGGGELLSLASLNTAANATYDPVTVASKTGIGFATTDLAVQYNKQRIVAYGARLRLQSGVNSTGEFTMAVMPLKGVAPPLNPTKPVYQTWDGTDQPFGSYHSGIGPRNTMNAYLDSLGLPFDFGASANDGTIDLSRLANIPTHATASASEIAARGMHLRGLPYESDARQFKSMAFKAIGTDCADAAMTVGNLSYGAQQLGVDYSFLRVGGHESMIIGGSGFPATTAVATLELVYHVEAVPNPRYTLLVRPTSTLPSLPASETLDNVLTKLHRLPRISFADIVSQAGDAILGEVEGRASGVVAQGLGSLAGALARLVV